MSRILAMRIHHIKGINELHKNFNPLNSVVKIIKKTVKIEILKALAYPVHKNKNFSKVFCLTYRYSKSQRPLKLCITRPSFSFGSPKIYPTPPNTF